MHCITFSSKNQTGPPKAWVSINPATQTNKTNNLLHPPGLLRAVAYGGVHLLSKLPEVASVELKRMTPRFELLSRHSTTTKKSTISATPTFLITHTLHGTGIYAAPWTPPGRSRQSVLEVPGRISWNLRPGGGGRKLAESHRMY